MPFKTEAFGFKMVSDSTSNNVFETDFPETCLSKAYCKQYVPVMYTDDYYLSPRKIKF